MTLRIEFDRTLFLTETDETPGVLRTALVHSGPIAVTVTERRWRARRDCRVELCGMTVVWKRECSVHVPCEPIALVIRAVLALLEIHGYGVTAMPAVPAVYGEE